MRIRILLGEGPLVSRRKGKNRRLAAAVAALLTPVAVMAGVLALWSVCAGLGLSGEFAISSGFFSHWLVWLTLAAAIEACAFLLNRYGSPRPRWNPAKPVAAIPRTKLSEGMKQPAGRD